MARRRTDRGAIDLVNDSQHAHGRVDYLRLSITDRCNLRCTYCMPAEGVKARGHGDILSYEELAAFARVAADLGITKVRITGGEPLVRLGCADFVGMLSRTSGIHDISLTTNGVLLPRFATDLREAGLKRVNISLDSLDPARFARITRGGRLQDTLAGIDAAFEAGFAPVKINALLLPGVEDELDAFVDLTRERDLHVRFIEFMPLDRRVAGDDLGGEGRLLPAGDLLRRLMERYVLVAHEGPTGTARRSTGTCPAHAARSASSPASPTTSARAATGCASPPTAACGPVCSRAARPMCDRCSPIPTRCAPSSSPPSPARSTIAAAKLSPTSGRCPRSEGEGEQPT